MESIMNYKCSKFNFYTCDGNNTLIFNSLTNSLTILDSNQINILKSYTFNDSGYHDFLEKQGVILNSNANEDLLAEEKYKSFVNKNVLHITIIPTMSCNFACIYCYEDKIVGSMSSTIIESLCLFVKRNLERYKALRISWFGGEPTLCMGIIEKLTKFFITVTRENRIPYIADITTNGSLLNANSFHQLYRMRVLTYQITIDGDEENHNRLRPYKNGLPTYKIIINNLKTIRDTIKSQMFNIIIRINLSSNSLALFDRSINELLDEFENDNRFTFLFKKVENWGGKSVDNISNELIGRSINFNNIIAEKILSSRREIRAYSQFPIFLYDSLCYASKVNSYAIGSYGQVYKCTVRLTEPINNIGVLNNDGRLVLNENVHVWEYNKLKYRNPKCIECALFANCFGGNCPIKQIENSDNYGSDECKKQENPLRALKKMIPEDFKKYNY